jgi:hypothetical protein
MLEVQAVSPTYPTAKVKKIHKDEYRGLNKRYKKITTLENSEETQDDAPLTTSQHIDECV